MESPSALRRKDTLTARGPPLRILSLDGGGVRGYSTLLILKTFMHQVVALCEGKAPENNAPLKPCEYFDLIAGTGTGGLIAIMLGRLRMSVDQCIEIYKEMTRVVFETDKTIAGIPYRSTLFKASKLEDAIRACVQDYEHEKEGTLNGPPGSPTRPGSMYSYRNTLPRRRSSLSTYGSRYGAQSITSLGNPNALMYDSRPHRTRTAVSAVMRASRGGTPVLLRSYPSQTQPTIESNCTIWQAGRATCATGLAFKPMQIGTSIFQDSGEGQFNPSKQILDEAVSSEWPGREVGLFLSVGCGKRSKKDRERQQEWWEGLAGDFAEAKRNLAAKIDKCEDTHQELLGRPRNEKEPNGERHPGYLRHKGVDASAYIRLNVESGVGEMGMNEWNQLVPITGSTEKYLNTQKVKNDIRHGAERMWEIQLRRQSQLSYNAFYQADVSSKPAPAPGPPPPDPNAVELPGEDPSTLYPRPLSKPGPQYPPFSAYQNAHGQLASPQDKFTIIASDLAPPSVDVSPRRSDESSYRPSSELYGDDLRVTTDLNQPPPLPPKTPIPYPQDHYRPNLPYRQGQPAPLPYPDTEGPPPVVNFARKPQYVNR